MQSEIGFSAYYFLADIKLFWF